MSDKEIKTVIQDIKAHGKKISKSKRASDEYLRKLGVISSTGKVKKAYEELCTPLGQG
jgi:hypothetical protein